jgi:hypothetical protein
MVDGTPRQLDSPALARRYGRELAAAAHAVLESREAAEAAAAAGIADVLRARRATTLPETAATLQVLTSATLRRADAARRHWRQVDPLADRTAPLAAMSFAVTAQAVSAALAAPPPDERRPRRAAWLVAAGVLLLAAAGIGLWLLPDGGWPAAGNPSPVPPPPSGAGEVAAASGPITLAGCRVEPASTPVAYRGWLTLGDLAGADAADAARPLFALVTAGEAEWLGWHEGGSGAMYPRPVGRVACAMDPFSGTTRVYAVAGDWQPPALLDACPPADIYKFGDLREIGGPRLFATLPIGIASWRADDPALRLYLRLAAPPNMDAAVTATARSLEADAVVPLTVERVLGSPAATPVRNLYLTLRNVDLPNAGCWIVSVALGGNVVGSTLVPVSEPARPVLLGP